MIIIKERESTKSPPGCKVDVIHQVMEAIKHQDDRRCYRGEVPPVDIVTVSADPESSSPPPQHPRGLETLSILRVLHNHREAVLAVRTVIQGATAAVWVIRGSHFVCVKD